jgi:nicotinate-nucleotide adenylyltransferase
MKIGLFFGSFNPVHIGHLAIANYIVEFGGINKLWFVISPQNPFKQKNTLLDEYQRLYMLELAIESDERFEVSNIEFKLPRPNRTIDTLAYLKEKYPQNEFLLIMGADNMEGLSKWKNAEILMQNYTFLIYPRHGYSLENIPITNYRIINAPQMDISSSMIRDAIHKGNNMRFFMPEKSYRYLQEMNFYKK